jgi:hypothetical protein
MDKTIILSKIKNYFGFSKDADLVRHLNISPQRFSNWKKRNSYDTNLIYTRCEVFNYEWLLSGKEPMLKNEIPDKNTNLPVFEEACPDSGQRQKQNIPLYDLENNGGLKNILDKGSQQAIILDFIKIPSLPECDGATFVKGNSMPPLIKTGDIIIFKSISPKDIFWGELYLIEIILDNRNTHTAIRYLKKSDAGDNFIRMVSENNSQEIQDISLDRINALALIQASIRLH